MTDAISRPRELTKWFGTQEQYDERKSFIEKYREVILDFRDFCLDNAEFKNTATPEQLAELGEDPFEEQDFYALSLGFFIAKGVSWEDAFDLARITRYSFQYWC